MRHRLPQRSIIACALIAVLLVAAGALYAQDGGDERPEDLIESYTFRPIDDIISAPLEVTNFAPDGTATLPLTTSIPVACTAVYGTTTDFGSLTLDQDMAGGTHTDHNPLLTGLEPETQYYFRVQGVDDSGVVYLSEIMTFTTPAFEQAAITNLAAPELGATITGYSSAFGGAALNDPWGAGMAFDNSPNTAWSSDGDGDDAWIEVALRQRARIDAVEFWTRSMANNTAQIFSFKIVTGEGEEYGPFELDDAAQSYRFDVDIEAQTLRFEAVETNGGNTGAVEIAVYGEFVE